MYIRHFMFLYPLEFGCFRLVSFVVSIVCVMSDHSIPVGDVTPSPHSPMEHSSGRRERLSQALLQILTEGSNGSPGSPSSSLLSSDLRELLIEFIENTNTEISELKRRVSTLEFLHE